MPRLTWIGGPTYKDLYLQNIETGESRTIATEMRGTPRWSPGEQYIYWWSYTDTAWHAYSVREDITRQLTNNKLGVFYNENNDRPTEPNAYGNAGWLPNDEAFIVYDRYDWWKLDPIGIEAPEKMTDFRTGKRRVRYEQIDPEEDFLPNGEVFVEHFNENNYYAGYGRLDTRDGKMVDLLSGPFRLSINPTCARLTGDLLYTKEDFQTFPDLLYAKGKESKKTAVELPTWDLRKSKKISSANPQQAGYGWGSSELFEWTDNQGRQLRGILVKPPNFDPNRKYPLLVNFYERSSEGVHRHRAPFPHRSTVNYSYYASRGYVIFNPDVIYRKGYPGESAYDCVMSGVTALMALDFIDAERVGLQGHSWGGYQVAHLLTKTNFFACAESGAPVVNMFSAYGGIRWRSGLSRQFQYERTQSRIGGTPWQYPIRYLENSPLFFLDKVETPVLIMHNDKDGAVPWYQGIEY
ncbi:MAG: prolyl oligopeptidase family serine peptidase, partial [Bacteroidota bacterium]